MNHKETRKEFLKFIRDTVKRTQIIYRDNLTGRFISAKRFKKLSKKRTSKEKIAFV